MSVTDGNLIDRMAKKHSVSPAAVPTLMAAVSTALVVFTFILSLLCRQTVAAKICLAKHYNFVMIAQAEPRWSPRFAEVEMPQSVVERAAATLLRELRRRSC